MPILLILLILFALFVIFFLAPAVVAVITVFGRGKETDLDSACQSGQFAPYADLLRSSSAALLARGPVRVSIDGPDGVRLFGDYYDLRADRTVLFFHGYRSCPLVNFAVQAESFAARGWNVLLPRQRAHGDSGGKRCYLGLKEQYDLLAWVDWAAGAGARELVVYGMSMGGAAAAYAADKLDPKLVRAAVVDCAFSSPYRQMQRDCIKRHVPWRLLMPLIRALAFLCYRIDIAAAAADSLSRARVPVFFLHGTSDETVPYEDGRSNFEACASAKAFFTAAGAGHTESFLADRKGAEEALFAFLSSDNETTNRNKEEMKGPVS